MRLGLSIPLIGDAIQGTRFSDPWIEFFRGVYSRIKSISLETYFPIDNNISVEKETGIQVDGEKTPSFRMQYYIQRISLYDFGVTGQEAVESGVLLGTYKPRSKTWEIKRVSVSDFTSGVTFTMDGGGKIKYTSSNMTGSWIRGSVSKCSFIMTTIEAKFSKPNFGWEPI